MKHLIFSAPILYGLGLLLVAGFPTESAKTSLNFSTSSKAEILPDPDVSQDIPEVSNEQAEAILNEMGYETLDGFEVDSRIGFSGSKKVRNFQRDYGLPENGILDYVTRLMIAAPRCGVKRSDKIASEAPQKWSKSTLTYSIANYPAGHPRDKIRELIKQAFNEWSKVTNLAFYEVADSNSADIEITFGGTIHKKRNGKCVFNSSTTLAHANYPEYGNIHFNTLYYFQQGRNLGEFLDTALHEIGHALGLAHFNSEASVMHPTASNYYTKPQPIDVMNIQALYGTRSGYGYKSPPTYCSHSKYDALFKDDSGHIYLFAGDYYYNFFASGNPKGQLISSKWPGLPGNIDAAFRYSNGKNYFFKGDKFYRFKGTQMEQPALRNIADGFPGLPGNVNAVMVDAKGKIYVYKGNIYWIYYPNKNGPSGPWTIDANAAVPAYVDAAVMSSVGDVISIKGKYWYKWTSKTGLSKGTIICT